MTKDKVEEGERGGGWRCVFALLSCESISCYLPITRQCCAQHMAGTCKIFSREIQTWHVLWACTVYNLMYGEMFHPPNVWRGNYDTNAMMLIFHRRKADTENMLLTLCFHSDIYQLTHPLAYTGWFSRPSTQSPSMCSDLVFKEIHNSAVRWSNILYQTWKGWKNSWVEGANNSSWLRLHHML